MILKKISKYAFVLLLTICSVVLAVAAIIYYVVATPVGTQAIVKYGLLRSAQWGSVSIGSLSGSILDGVVLKDVVISNAPLLGKGSLVHLQQLDVRMATWDWHKIQMKVFNGRIDLLNCDPMVFNATYVDGNVQGNAYSRSMDVSNLMQPFLPNDVWRNLQGLISDVDMDFMGTLNAPRIKGSFFVEHISYLGTTVREAMTRFDLSFPLVSNQRQMIGPLILEDGRVNVRRSMMDLMQSQAIFKGDYSNPVLEVFGTTQADAYTIDLTISGTLQHPALKVRSDPYLSEDAAFMMLGLGNWAPSDLSLQYDDDVRKFGVKKKISDDIKVGVQLEETPASIGQQPSYTKTVEGELSLTDRISVNVAQKVQTEEHQERTTNSSTETIQNKGESQIYLKYKNVF